MTPVASMYSTARRHSWLLLCGSFFVSKGPSPKSAVRCGGRFKVVFDRRCTFRLSHVRYHRNNAIFAFCFAEIILDCDRFDRRPPSDSTELDTRLNTELVQEVVTVIHPDPDKKVDILILELLGHGEALPDDGDEKRGPQGSEERGDAGGAKTEGFPHVRYLTLRRILCFCFQHPALLFPVVQFQRVLRSKIIGKSR